MKNTNNYQTIPESFSQLYDQMLSFSDTDKLIAFFVSMVSQVFQAERVSLMLLDNLKQELSVKASFGLSAAANNSRMKLGEMFGGWVAQQGSPLLVKDVEKEFPDALKDRSARYKTKSFIIMPLRTREGIIGVLSLTERKSKGVFSETDFKSINLFCYFLGSRIENIKLLHKNAELACLDILTGLSNHRYFQERLMDEIYRVERYRHALSLLMLDIDNFSWYNQSYGYSAGDSALRQVSRIIKANTRRIDLAARFGPEEFALVLPNIPLRQAVFVGERIKQAVGDSIFAEDRTSSLGMARLTVSLGVAAYRIGLGKEELVRRAVSALSEAKQGGKNRVCVYR
jgi:diguanylate cyclase (GGDEF)-like protein